MVEKDFSPPLSDLGSLSLMPCVRIWSSVRTFGVLRNSTRWWKCKPTFKDKVSLWWSNNTFPKYPLIDRCCWNSILQRSAICRRKSVHLFNLVFREARSSYIASEDVVHQSGMSKPYSAVPFPWAPCQQTHICPELCLLRSLILPVLLLA